jgi:hypothetical protein
MRALIRAIERAGAEVVGGGCKHWKVFVDGKLIVTMSSSSSDRNARHSVLSELRQAGLEVRI